MHYCKRNFYLYIKWKTSQSNSVVFNCATDAVDSLNWIWNIPLGLIPMCPLYGSTAHVVCELLYTAALITKPTSEELILAKKKKKKPDSIRNFWKEWCNKCYLIPESVWDTQTPYKKGTLGNGFQVGYLLYPSTSVTLMFRQ